jgi:Skp family chaperone for outer membrane proteins
MSMRSLAAFVALLVVAVACSRRSDAVEPILERPALKVTTAYINLTAVVKNYDRFKQFSQEIREEVSDTETKVNKLKSQLQAAAQELADQSLTQDERKAIERRVTLQQRRFEDTVKEGREFIGKKTDEQLVTIYKDIHAEVTRYARANGIEAVLHYNDAAPDSKDYFTPQNISRKMQAGAAMPVYLAPGADISDKVVEALNARHHRGR